MARKGRGKGKFRRYLRGNINNVLALGTLAATTMISGVVDDNVTESCWLSSVVLRWNLSQFTPGNNDGPITVGIAHGDYSTAEIEAWYENTSSWEQGDLVATREVGRRLCKVVGTFGTEGASDAQAWMALNNGRPIKMKCGWLLSTGQTVKVWAYNQGSSALATTDPQVIVSGHANLWPSA